MWLQPASTCVNFEQMRASARALAAVSALGCSPQGSASTQCSARWVRVRSPPASASAQASATLPGPGRPLQALGHS
eukprot:11093289-Alexandrium_andersonii.AAC.1